MLAVADLRKLLHGPYRPPSVRVGDRVTCLVRDGECVVTSWSDARIPWPRCRKLGFRGGSGLLVDEELARAVRCESAYAIRYWFGLSMTCVWSWRRQLGVERLKARLAFTAYRLTGWRTAAGVNGCRRRNGLRPKQRPGGRPWKKAELRLLGKASDDVVARWLRRTTVAVRCMRCRLVVPTKVDRRRKA